jgi:uncharacterized membrane protein YccC
MNPPGRAIATFAVGFLLLDAVLLSWFGLELSRPSLVSGGIACGVAACAVVLMWRRYRRTLADLEVRRREMRAEVEVLRDLLKEQHLQN